jgi:hypothetical protein
MINASHRLKGSESEESAGRHMWMSNYGQTIHSVYMPIYSKSLHVMLLGTLEQANVSRKPRPAPTVRKTEGKNKQTKGTNNHNSIHYLLMKSYGDS